LGPWLSVSFVRVSGSTSRPIGTLSQKIHCHAMPSVTAPPTSGPSAIARPAMPLQAPRARPRWEAGTASVRSVRLSGVTIAPPMPWNARAAISSSIDGASAAAADPTVNRPMPATKMRRRPKRSPSAAPVSSSTANVSV
jgi:hypothetical protein